MSVGGPRSSSSTWVLQPVAFLLTLLVVVAGSAAAQEVTGLGGSLQKLTPVLTDQYPLDVPQTFAVPGVRDGNASGAAIAPGNTALFFRPAGTTTQTRLLQMNDPIPGMPGTRTDVITAVKVSQWGHVAVYANFNGADGISIGAILTWDGSNFHTMAVSYDAAPGTAGLNFGRGLNLVGIDNAGDVAFTSSLADSTGAVMGQSTLFITPAGGSPMRIMGYGDAAPGMPAGTTIASISPGAMTSSGQMVVNISTSGTVKGSELVLASTAGLQKIVASNDFVPTSSTVTFGNVISYRWSDAGKVLFSATAPAGGSSVALYLYTPGPTPSITTVLTSGSPAPADIGGTLNTGFVVRGINDNGVAIFSDGVTGSSFTGGALFRLAIGGALQTVAHPGQAAPGTSSTFSSFVLASINSSADVAFLAQFANGAYGVFQQAGTNPVSALAVDGQAAPLLGGGVFSLGNDIGILMQDDGEVWFRSDILGGVADYGEFAFLPSGIVTRMSTEDALPAGARMSIRSFGVNTAGNYFGFSAALAGGRQTLFTRNLQTGQTDRVVADGDLDLITGNRMQIGTSTVFVNARGQVPYQVNFMGLSRGSAIYLWDPTTAASLRLVGSGDVANPTNGVSFTNVLLTQYGAPPINDAGQVVVSADLSDNTHGFYMAAHNVAPAKIVLSDDASPAGGTFYWTTSAKFWQPVINQAGEVGFFGHYSVSGITHQGIFLGTPGGPVAKIAAYGDAAPSGTFNDSFAQTVSMNDKGEVAFSARFGSTFSSGLFVGSATGAPAAIALQGGTASNGNFGAFSSSVTDAVAGRGSQPQAARACFAAGHSADHGNTDRLRRRRRG